MSKLHTTIIFWVGTPFLPIKGIWFSCDTQARTCVPSIAPILFYKKKKFTNQFKCSKNISL
jgi:hypothetical protein